MSLVKAIEVKEYEGKKIDFEVETLREMELYMKYVNADTMPGNEGYNYVVNEAIKYVLSKDSKFKKWKKEMEKKELEENKGNEVGNRDVKNKETGGVSNETGNKNNTNES